MTITALPDAPSRSDTPADFISKADAFVAALAILVTEMNAAIGIVNMTKWISGTTYAIGDVTWSPADFQAYRRKTAGAGTTDPSADSTNWQRTEVSATSIQNQTYKAWTTGGTSTAFTLTPTPAVAALAENQEFDVEFHTAAGATPTLAVSGLTAKSLKYRDSAGAKSDVTSAQIPSGWRSKVVYDGTDYIVREVPPPALRAYLAGLTLSTAGSSATMTTAAGQATDSTNAVSMSLASAMSKTTSAWSAGTGNGGLDTGTIANATWYHWFLIGKADGTTDVLASLSATAPTMPSGYTYKRRIGSGLTNGSAQWVAFTQDGDYVRWSASVLDVNATNPGTASVTATLASVPTGVRVKALINANLRLGTSSSAGVYVRDLSATDEAPNNPATTSPAVPGASFVAGSGTGGGAATLEVRTNTSAQIGYRMSASGASDVFGITTLGWIDRRGRDD